MFFVFVTILIYFLITKVRYILKSLSRLTIHILFVIYIGFNLFGMLYIHGVCVCVYQFFKFSFQLYVYGTRGTLAGIGTAHRMNGPGIETR